MNNGLKYCEESYAFDGVLLGFINKRNKLKGFVCLNFKVGRQCFKTASTVNKVLGIFKRSLILRAVHRIYCTFVLITSEVSS